MLVQIPFSGFYQSVHDMIIEDMHIDLFQDDNGGIDFEALDASLRNTNFISVFHKYAVEYVEHYAHNLKHDSNISLDFVPSVLVSELISPREYNFTTDKIMAHLTDTTVKAIYSAVMSDNDLKQELADKMIKVSTPRSGYVPFISTLEFCADWENTPVTDWAPRYVEILLSVALSADYMDNICQESSFTDGLDLPFGESVDDMA